jgi:hypothetical protein
MFISLLRVLRRAKELRLMETEYLLFMAFINSLSRAFHFFFATSRRLERFFEGCHKKSWQDSRMNKKNHCVNLCRCRMIFDVAAAAATAAEFIFFSLVTL